MPAGRYGNPLSAAEHRGHSASQSQPVPSTNWLPAAGIELETRTNPIRVYRHGAAHAPRRVRSIAVAPALRAADTFVHQGAGDATPRASGATTPNGLGQLGSASMFPYAFVASGYSRAPMRVPSSATFRSAGKSEASAAWMACRGVPPRSRLHDRRVPAYALSARRGSNRARRHQRRGSRIVHGSQRAYGLSGNLASSTPRSLRSRRRPAQCWRPTSLVASFAWLTAGADSAVIRINQVLLPDAPKVAVLCTVGGGDSGTRRFVVRDQRGQSSWPRSATSAGAFGPCAQTWRLDFSALRKARDTIEAGGSGRRALYRPRRVRGRGHYAALLHAPATLGVESVLPRFGASARRLCDRRHRAS